MSAFLSYSQEMRPKIRDIHPELKNTEISSILAHQWRAASDEDKRPHIEKELQQREKYYENMAKWKADEEVRKKSSSDSSLPSGPGCKTQLDFLDIGTASRENSEEFWSSIEHKHGSYEPNETEASSIDRMNQYLSDGGANESVTDFWDHAFEDTLDQSGFDGLESSPLTDFPDSSNPPDAAPDVPGKTGVSSSSKEDTNQKSPNQRRSKRKTRDNLSCGSSDSTSHHSSKRKRSTADAEDGEDKDKVARSVRKDAQSSTSSAVKSDHMGHPPPPRAFYFPLPAPSSSGSTGASEVSSSSDALAQSMLPSYALGFYLARLQQQLQMEQQVHHHQQQQQQARHDEEILAQQQQIDQQQRLLQDLYAQNQHLLQRGGPQSPHFPYPIIPNLLMTRPITSGPVNSADVSACADDSAALAAAGGQRNDKSVWQRRLPQVSASPVDHSCSAMSVSDKTSSESVSTISGRTSHSGSSRSGKRKNDCDDSGQKEDFSYTMDRFRESPINQTDQTVMRMNVNERPYRVAEDAAALNADGASDHEDLTSDTNSKRETVDIVKDDVTGKRQNPPTEIIAKLSSSGHKKGGATQNSDSATISFSSSQQSQKPFPPPPLYQQMQHPYLFPQLHLVPPQFQFLQPTAGMSMASAVSPTGNASNPDLTGPNAAVAAAMLAAATAALSQGLVPIPYPVSVANFVPSASSVNSKNDSSQSSREVSPVRSRLTHAVLNSLPPPLAIPPSEPVFRVESSLPSSASNTEAVTPATSSSSSASTSSASLTAPGTCGMSKLAMTPTVYEGPLPPVIVDDTNKVNHEVLVNAPTLLKLALRVGYDEDVFGAGDTANDDRSETKL